MLVESWKFRCQQRCFVNFNFMSTGRLVAQLKNTGQNTLVVLKPMNLWGNAWKDLFTRIMKIILQEKGWIHWVATIWCANIIPLHSSNKNTRCKGSSGERVGKTREIPEWQLTKVRNKNEVIAETRTEDRKVHFASLMDICHLKNAELQTKHQKYQERVVLRDDFVKDDSGSYAAFTEQGSSVSQMTAAKVMDIISKLSRVRTQDKQQMQYLLTSRLKWKMQHHC